MKVLHLKRFLAVKKFCRDFELKESFENRLIYRAADFYEQGIKGHKNLMPCYDKCLSVNDDYVEK